jgi:2-polyprenyl-3-methyl-5-hydroxy-6-metoxy-1,4-benzoquinol methylase
MYDNSWDADYSSGDFRHWEPNTSSPELAALVAAGSIRKVARVLDVGCGGGLDAIFLAQCGFNVAGVDLSKVALEIAQQRANKAKVEVDWLASNVFNLPFDSGTFDFVTDRGLFHLVEDIDRPRYSAEIFRVLRPSGYVVIRGASREVGQDRFNPVTEEAVDKAFPKSSWTRGAVVPLLLSSCAGTIDARIVVLQRLNRKLVRQATG